MNEMPLNCHEYFTCTCNSRDNWKYVFCVFRATPCSFSLSTAKKNAQCPATAHSTWWSLNKCHDFVLPSDAQSLWRRMELWVGLSWLGCQASEWWLEDQSGWIPCWLTSILSYIHLTVQFPYHGFCKQSWKTNCNPFGGIYSVKYQHIYVCYFMI